MFELSPFRMPRWRRRIINTDPYNHARLARQVAIQQHHAWDIDTDVPWDWGIDIGRCFLPLDDCAIAFPGAAQEQRLALSQLMGLIVNATVSEMEQAIPRLKKINWADILRDYPVSPEMWRLGESFFEEEAKHAQAFLRYQQMFCNEVGIEMRDLDRLLPKAFGSFFQRAVVSNALAGGHAFWWVVAMVEEVSISIFEAMYRRRHPIDPLYFELHRLHLEEESRHANYAFLMLKVIRDRPKSLRRLLHRKTDFILAQFLSTPWVLTELMKFFEVKKFKGVHPFFDTLVSCIPLFESMPKRDVVQRMFGAAPYISWLLNPRFRKKHVSTAIEHGALIPLYPRGESRQSPLEVAISA